MPSSARRILCAEANVDVCDLIILMLEQKGYQVTGVQTIAECLATATSEHFDLYILNDTYADGNSIELCQKLRALDPLTPVLLFSLHNPDQNLELARTENRNTYLTKTTDFVALVQTIDQLLQSG